MQYDLHLAQDSYTFSHSRAFKQHKDFYLVAAVDNKKEQRDEFSQKYSLPAYDDLSEALKIHSPDVVVIATSTQTHAEVLSTVLDVSVDINSDMENTKEQDSFAHVLIMIELKSEFGLNVEQEDFHELTSVEKIIGKLAKKDG